MKALRYITNHDKRPVWVRAYHIWQKRPHEVASLSEEMRTCASCGTTYQGNYCPRCGQSARIGRFSFKKAALLFLDVWGMGNRSMFRSIRDLMFRPGYMICDYLKGMQSAYFPPFKMFFLLAALSLVVEHGFNLGLDETVKDAETDIKEQVEQVEQAEQVEQTGQVEQIEQTGQAEQVGQDEADRKLTVNGVEVDSPMYDLGAKFANIMNTLRKKNPAIFSLLSLLVFTIPLYFFLRHSPTIPDLHYSEFVVALVYTANAYSIYSIAGNILNSSILKIIAVLIVFVAFRQFSGYSKRRILGYILLTMLISVVIMATIAGIVLYLLYLKYGE